jgi:hypothetical protein
MRQTPSVQSAPPPASATPAPAAQAVTQAPASAIPTPISPEQAAFLRARRQSLKDQLDVAQERRDDIANRLRGDELQAAERPGLEERLRVLDDRLVKLEKDIALNGEQLANSPARTEATTLVAPNGQRRSLIDRASPNLALIAAVILLVPIIQILGRRWLAPTRKESDGRSAAEISALNARMDRMDSALDAVAVEVERIGESQRFLTQTLTERAGPAALPAGGPAFEGVTVRQRVESEAR